MPPAPPPTDDAALRAKVVEFMGQGIPFNRWLGIEIVEFGGGEARLRIPFRDELIGDPFRPAIHGGVIATLVDMAGGAAVFTKVALGDRLSTIDLRVDYLRPAGKAALEAHARVIRIGNRVAVARVHVEGNDPREEVAQGVCVFSVRRQ